MYAWTYGITMMAARGGRLRRAALMWATVLLAGVGAVDCSAAENAVVLAGWAYAGDHQSVDTRFPFTSRIDRDLRAQGTGGGLSRQVVERTYAGGSAGLTLAPRGELAGAARGDQTLISVLLLSGETASVEAVGDVYKIFLNLRGNALVFDHKTKTLVRSYPVSATMYDAAHSPPSPAMLADRLRDLLLTSDKSGLVSQYVSRIGAATLPLPGSKTLQVEPVEVDPEALALLPVQVRTSQEQAGHMLAESFGAILADKLAVPVLPSGVGQVMGAMSFRLESGDMYSLKSEAADYLVHFKLKRLAKLKSGENAVGRSFVYGAYAALRVYEPTLDTNYLQSEFKNGEVKVVPGDQHEVDDAPAYEAAIRGLFLKVADVLRVGADEKWARTAASATDINRQLEQTRLLLRSCK